MSLTSLAFAGFAAVVLVAYYTLPRRAQNWLLLAASYAFYASWSWWYVAVLCALTAINFALGQRVYHAAEARPRRGVLAIGIALNVLALAVFKFEDFFLPDLRARLNDWGTLGSLELLLPVGMSFYVVMLISYLLDVANGHAEPARDPVDFALYVAYFPRLLSGPITRARDFLPKLAAPRVVDDAALARSVMLIITGLVRKLVFADSLFLMLPARLFTRPERFMGQQLAFYLLVYALALYNDFAGYSQVARGVSGLLGIELPVNFRVPYLSRSFSDFWNRWHITLSNWLRDYIYMPASRALLARNPSRGNVPNLLLPPMATMLISGFWHGTGWTMLLWGALHGVYLVGERLLALWRPPRPPRLQPRWPQVTSGVVVLILVMLAWVPFATPDLALTIDYWRGLLDWSEWWRPPLRLIVALGPVLWLDWVQRNDELVFLRWPRLVQAGLLAVACLLIFLASQADASVPFVYQGF